MDKKKKYDQNIMVEFFYKKDSVFQEDESKKV